MASYCIYVCKWVKDYLLELVDGYKQTNIKDRNFDINIIVAPQYEYNETHDSVTYIQKIVES